MGRGRDAPPSRQNYCINAWPNGTKYPPADRLAGHVLLGRDDASGARSTAALREVIDVDILDRSVRGRGWVSTMWTFLVSCAMVLLSVPPGVPKRYGPANRYRCEVADEAGVTSHTVKRWERQGDPEPPEDVCRWLGVAGEAHRRGRHSLHHGRRARRVGGGAARRGLDARRAPFDPLGRSAYLIPYTRGRRGSPC